LGWTGWSSTLVFLFWQRYRLTPKFRIQSKLKTYSIVFCRIFVVIFLMLLMHWVVITVDLYVASNPLDFLWRTSVRIKDRGEPQFDSLTCQVPPISLLLHFVYVVVFLLLFNISHVRSQKRLINVKMKKRILHLQTTVTLTTMITIVVHVLELVANLFAWPWVKVGMRYLAIVIDILFYLIVATGYIFIPVYDTMRLSNYKITVHRLNLHEVSQTVSIITAQSVPDIQPLINEEREEDSSIVQHESSLHTLQLTQTASKATLGTTSIISAANTQDDDDNEEEENNLSNGKARARKAQNRLTIKDRLSSSSSDRASYALLSDATTASTPTFSQQHLSLSGAPTSDSMTPVSPAMHREKDRLLKSSKKDSKRKTNNLDEIELRDTSILVDGDVEEFDGIRGEVNGGDNAHQSNLVMEPA